MAVGINANVPKGAWNQQRASSRFMGISPDSIWMWEVEPKGNLSLSTPERNGRIVRLVPGMLGVSESRIVDAEVLVDGDPTTFYDADLFSRRHSDIGRTTAVILDLGGTFRVNRLRFFPRMDPRNQRRFLQEFSVSTHAESARGVFEELFSFYPALPNEQPVVEKRFASRDVRFVQIAPTSQRPWEIAELEVYGDGSLPAGEYLSQPIRFRGSVFGLVRYEGNNLGAAPLLLHTRVGPDKEPELYFVREEEGDELVRVEDQGEYLKTPVHLRGPIRPDPNWSSWEPVSQGVVRSPNLERYMQFRVRLFTPGVRLDRIVFETVSPPLVRTLLAEVSPDTVAAGVETDFSLGLLAHMRVSERRRSRDDTGFEQILIESNAQISQVQRVRVDDRTIPFTSRRQPGGGVMINLVRAVEQDGSFIQVLFRAAVYRDKTGFRVRVLDERMVKRRTPNGTIEVPETGYQFASPGDADVETTSSGLVVTLFKNGARAPLLANVEFAHVAFTPNGDGVNDELEIGYSLLTVTEPTQVELAVYDLGGQRVATAFAAMESVGTYRHVWDGLGDDGQLVAPGTYIYRMQVKGDGEPELRQGVVAVVY